MNPSVNIRLAVRLLLLSMLGSAPPAFAEKADSSKPINIEANSVTVDDQRKVSVYLGNVLLVQGSMLLRAERIEVRQDPAGFNSASAFGKPVRFRQKRDGAEEYIEGFADRMEYDGKQSLLELFDNARLKRGEDELRGSYISYNANTEFFEVKGNGSAGKSPAGGNGRVRAVIQPKPAKPGAPAAPAPVKPADSVQP